MKEKKHAILSDILWFLGTLAVVFLAYCFLFTPIEVRGDSMDPTLANNELIFGLRVGGVKRFDIVAFHAPEEGKDYIKRVIGLPGDQIEYKNDQLFINGKALEEPYLNQFKGALEQGELLTEDFSYTVPEGQYFVMGDHRQISKDSRIIGTIARDKIVANAKFIYWPLDKIAVVE